MTTTTRPERERINTPENRRLIAEDVARLVALAKAEEARRFPNNSEGR